MHRAALTFARWRETWRALGADAPGVEAFGALVDRYGEPHRAYHTMRHLEECFARWAEVRAEAARPGEVEAALWYHDAVYDPHRDDNEARSAALAREALHGAGLPAEVADRVEALILTTRHAGPPPAGDAALLVDVDLAILAAPPERFDEYERQVRVEYGGVPGPIFRAKRRAILEALLDREHLFASAHFRRVAERAARTNLQRTLAH